MPQPLKVVVEHNGKKHKILKKYLGNLKGQELKKQIASILGNKDRPKTSYRQRRSSWVVKFKNKYGVPITNKTFINKNIITRAGIEKILHKGRGAYYSSGSRPNQTADSWAYARLASVILNGPSRKIDQKIWDRFKR